MPAVTVSAIVLRSVNYRDNDRMLTLLTPGRGRVEVFVPRLPQAQIAVHERQRGVLHGGICAVLPA